MRCVSSVASDGPSEDHFGLGLGDDSWLVEDPSGVGADPGQLPLRDPGSGVGANQGQLPRLRTRIFAAGLSLCTLGSVACYWASGKAASSLIESADIFMEEFQSERGSCHVLHHVQQGGCDSHLQESLDLIACKKQCLKHEYCLGIEHHGKECRLLIGETCDFERSYHEKAVCYATLGGVRDPEGEGILVKDGEEACHACLATQDLETCVAMCTSRDECKSFSYGQWGNCSACCIKAQQVSPTDKIILPDGGTFSTHYQTPCEQGGWLVESRDCFDCASKFSFSRGQKFGSGRRQACGSPYMGPDGQCVFKSVREGEMDKCSEAAEEVKAVHVQEQMTSTKSPAMTTDFLTLGSRFTPRGVIPPDGKLYFAISSDGILPSKFKAALDDGMQIPAFAFFHELPLRGYAERDWVKQFLSDTASVGGIAYLTAEPRKGLWMVDKTAVEELAWLCKEFENEGGAGCIIRFGHEMNGNWYIWGQQPYLYIDRFRVLSEAIHRLTKRSGMMWAPSSGGEYPFEGYFKVKPGTPDFFALDTNKDGKLDMTDDMYTPFYPGDDFVDWVGLTNSFFGNRYPYDSNELAQPKFFVDKIRGNYRTAGQGGNERAVPNFYEMFSGENSAHKKPFAVAETSALWGPDLPQRRSDLEVKQEWWRQVFLEGTRRRRTCTSKRKEQQGKYEKQEKENSYAKKKER
eukprot:TRINITY_DN4735_c0_g1_i1.p1 TRINITY_DN4735_c0_g1~~TRINITY_DN4735_c0_g1_i1.p1  ORF type:complete len:689 (-),score=92.78 TRINITY_DN4735_c0_g1_i1:315-2381(-)